MRPHSRHSRGSERARSTVSLVAVGVLVAGALGAGGWAVTNARTDGAVAEQVSSPVVATPSVRSTGGAQASRRLQRPDAGPSSTGASSTGSPVVTPRKPKLPRYKVIPAGKPFRLAPVPVDLTYSFTVGTLNVLGSNHTRHSKQWAPGVVRTRAAAAQIRNRGIDLIGMQEVQDDQLGVLLGNLPGYTIWPRDTLGGSGIRLQIAFSNSLFELVDTGTIITAFSHQRRPIPWVKLRDRATGGEFYYVTLHNSPRGLESERDAATGAEIVLLNSLLSSGLPVMVAGDTNEPSEFFCRVGAATGMGAANGGSAGSRCVLPPRPTGLDWVMGGNGTSFSRYVRDKLGGISDHPIVHSDVTMTTTVLRRPDA